MSDESTIRVRFAPSPTGHLHIGGARTALFNWLFARRGGGKFVLRIEDTDRERSTEGYIDSIIDGLKWMGLDWDEGPFRQTERIETYKKYIARLMTGGYAYHCYCTQDELDKRRKEAQQAGTSPAYDRRCRGLDGPIRGIKPTVRFAMPKEGTVVVEDMIRGNVTFDNSQLDDLIIMRSDGTPTYNLVVVADDMDMGITHIIRGDDHLNNTPKQIHICRALGGETPRFAHLPMILGEDKARLSKRHGATSVTAYRDEGYLPGALVNYLARLGWSHGDKEIFSIKELVELFSFENVGKSAAVFNPEKLLWLNAEHLKTTDTKQLATMALPYLIKDGTVRPGAEPDIEWLARAVATLTARAKTLAALALQLKYYITPEVEYQEKARGKFLNESTLPFLNDIYTGLDGLGEDNFREESLKKVFESVMKTRDVKLGKLAQPVRVALTGGTESPGIFEVLEVLGRTKSLERLQRAILAAKEED